MAISNRVKNALNGASWVRRMFEEGEELKRAHGEENVFDFSLGNPNLEPPASLKKALKALADCPVPGMHRYMPNCGYSETRTAIAEYLAEESFRQQPLQVQSFLVRTSILAQMNAATCNAILNIADSQAMLERIEQGNLFLLSLDEKREWYRYHNLYHEFLRARLYRQDAQAAREIERAAGAYYESVGEWEAAASHYMQAGDLASAARVIADMAPTYFDSGRVQVLNHLLSALPSSELRAHPLLLIYHGAVLRRLRGFHQKSGADR